HLQGQMAAGVDTLVVDELHHGAAINLDLEGPPADDDLQGEPLLRANEFLPRLEQHAELLVPRLHHQRPSRVRLAGGEMDLGLIALDARSGVEVPQFNGAAEEDAAVALGVDAGLEAEVEVLEVVALAEQEARWARAVEDAILDPPVAWRIGVRHPAGQILAI